MAARVGRSVPHSQAASASHLAAEMRCLNGYWLLVRCLTRLEVSHPTEVISCWQMQKPHQYPAAERNDTVAIEILHVESQLVFILRISNYQDRVM